jgi:two-component system, OmpR family, sensor histidine kinase KdpD
MRLKRLTAVGGYLLVVVVIAAVTVVLLPLRPVLQPVQVMLLYVPALVWLGRTGRVRVTALAAVVAFLAVDFLFVPPYYTIAVTNSVDWVTLVLFLGVALAAGLQTGRMRRREEVAVQRQREIALLNRLSSRLVSEKSVEDMASFIVSEVVEVLGADRAALYLRTDDDTATLVADAGAPRHEVTEQALADWVVRNDKAVALPAADDMSQELRPVVVPASEALPGVVADGTFVPLQTPGGLEGVMHARPAAVAELRPEGARLVLAVANLAAVFLERHRLEEKAAHATALAESDRLKSTLISSVSHELKTPLAAVTARVTGLLEEGEGCDAARVRSELEAVSEDLGRLDASIGDLLDVSRLESDSWRPRLELFDVGEVLGTVASRIPVAQRPRVTFEVPSGLPQIRVDFAQIARAVSNLVENALVYSPEGSPVVVGARALGDDFLVWVEDRGPGVPEDERTKVFEKFYRGSASAVAPAGTGLGLAIVREIVRSHGGRVWVEAVQPVGARFVVSLPLRGEA